MNVLPIIFLSTVALGYMGAIDRADRYFDLQPAAHLTAYPASGSLSVHEIMARAPQSVDQPFCDQTSKVVETLIHDFAETEQDNWVQGKDMAFHLWGSGVLGTWTLLHIGQDGVACIVASGTGWSEGVVPADVIALIDVANS